VWNAKSITISDPDITVCVYDGGAPGGCPNSGTEYSTLGAALSAIGGAQTSHVYFERGASYGSISTIDATNGNFRMYGAYASGAKPRFTQTSEQSMQAKIMWQDLDMGNGDTTRVLNIADDNVFRRCEWAGAVGGSPSYALFASGDSNWAILDSDINTSANNGAAMYSIAPDHATFAGSTWHHAGSGPDHNIRLNAGTYTIFANNVITCTGTNGDCLTIRGNSDTGVRLNEWLHIYGNDFDDERVVVKPQSDGESEEISRVVYRDNLHRSSSWLFFQAYDQTGWSMQDWLVMNNAIIGGGDIIDIDPARDDLTNIVFYNNTSYQGSIGTCPTGCTQDNNYATSTAGNFESVTPGDSDFLQPTSPVNGTDLNIFRDYHNKIRANPPDDGAVEVP
jgi:hypothetical protein